MRFTVLTAAIVATSLALPQAASAIVGEYGDYPAPTGSICHNGVCFQLGQGESVTENLYRHYTPTTPTFGFYYTSTGGYGATSDACWYIYKTMADWHSAGSPVSAQTCVYVGSETITRKYRRWLFDIPAQDRDNIQPLQQAIYNEDRVGGQLVGTRVSVGDPLAQTKDTYCSFYSASNYDGEIPRGVGLDRTPDEIMQACSFTRRQSDPEPDSGTSTTQPFVSPESTRCKAVGGSGGLWAVRTLRARCDVSQNIIAQYSKTLRSPSGWRCTALITDASTKARCTRLTRSGSTAYGIRIR